MRRSENGMSARQQHEILFIWGEELSGRKQWKEVARTAHGRRKATKWSGIVTKMIVVVGRHASFDAEDALEVENPSPLKFIHEEDVSLWISQAERLESS